MTILRALARFGITLSDGPSFNPCGRRVPLEPRPAPQERPAFKDRLGFIDKRCYRAPHSSPTTEVADLLRRQVPKTGAWWSANLWQKDRRDGRWQEAAAVVVGVAFHDIHGRPATPPPELAQRLVSLDLPGNVFVPTERGALLVFVGTKPIKIRKHFLGAFEKAALEVQHGLAQLGLAGRTDERAGWKAGFGVDRSDPTRAWWEQPNARTPGGATHQRGAHLLVLRETPSDLKALAAVGAPQPAPADAAHAEVQP